MNNWFVDENEIKEKMINAIMDELGFVVDEATEEMTANYWIDRTHNIFAFVNGKGNDHRWLEIHYELYDCNEEIIGDLLVLDTDGVSREELLKEIVVIVNSYYGVDAK